MKATSIGCFLFSALVILFSGSVFSQQFPAKPVRLIVPFAPGGSTDIMGRLLSQRLAQSLGQQFNVDNRGGAGTRIGTEIAAKAPADGYTIILTNVAFSILPGLHGSRLPYDSIKDFLPISLIASQPTVLAAHPSFPAKSVADVIRIARQNPGQLSYASSGVGGPGHIAGEMFNLLAGVKLIHVPYKGGGPAVIDLMTGQVTLGFVGMPGAMSHAKAGRVRFIAYTDSKRASVDTSLQTIQEGGLKNYQVENWIGMLAPAGVPPHIINQLHEELVKTVRTPEIKERLGLLGFEIIGSTPAEFKTLLDRDIKAFTLVIEKAQIKPN